MRDITQEIFDTYSNPATRDPQSPTLYLWTEFMTADGYCAKPEAVIRHLMTSPNQKNLIAQIHGGNIKTLLKTVKAISNWAPLRKGLQSSKAGEGELEASQGDLLNPKFIGIELNL